MPIKLEFRKFCCRKKDVICRMRLCGFLLSGLIFYLAFLFLGIAAYLSLIGGRCAALIFNQNFNEINLDMGVPTSNGLMVDQGSHFVNFTFYGDSLIQKVCIGTVLDDNRREGYCFNLTFRRYSLLCIQSNECPLPTYAYVADFYNYTGYAFGFSVRASDNGKYKYVIVKHIDHNPGSGVVTADLPDNGSGASAYYVWLHNFSPVCFLAYSFFITGGVIFLLTGVPTTILLSCICVTCFKRRRNTSTVIIEDYR